MNKYQEALNRIIDEYIPMHYEGKPMNQQTTDALLLQELVDKATPMKPIQLEKGKYSCPSCAMAFKLKTSVKNMFVNNQYCDVCGQSIDWSEEDE